MDDFLKFFWLWIPWAFGSYGIAYLSYYKIKETLRKREIEKGYDLRK